MMQKRTISRWLTGIRSRLRATFSSPYWTILWIIVAIAAVARLLMFARGLPYVTETDEPHLYTTVQGWRGLYHSSMLQGYPPVILGIDFVVQLATEAIGHPGLASAVWVMRLMSVGYGLGTLLLISLLARRIAGDLAGLVAGAIWALSPLLLENTINAQADPLGFLLVTASLFLTVAAMQSRERRSWCVTSFLVGLAAVLTKYPLFPILIPPGLVALYVFVRENRRQGFLFLAVQVLLASAVLFFLAVIYHAQDLTAQAPGLWAHFQTGFAATFLPMYVNTFSLAMQAINPAVVLITWVLGVAAYAIAARLGRARSLHPQRAQVLPILMLGLAAVLLNGVPSLMAQGGEWRWRDLLPIAPVICVFFGIAIWQITEVLPRIAGRYPLLLKALPAFAVFAVILVPQTIGTVNYIRVNRLEAVQVALRTWADVNLDPGPVLVGYDHERTFNTIYGGIPGQKWFNWWRTAISTQSLDEWRHMGMQYAALGAEEVQRMTQTADGHAYLDHMLLLRSFAGVPVYNGAPTMFYRLWRPQVETQIGFTDSTFDPTVQINLVGYDLADGAHHPITGSLVSPDGQVLLTLYWQALATPQINYSVFVHLRNADGSLLAQVDTSPGINERPTSTWDDRSETIIGRPLSLKLPANLPAGRYKLVIGLYDSATGHRLTTSDGASESQVCELVVQSAASG